MKKLLKLATMLLATSINASAGVGEMVSIVELISNPKKYHGKKVIITGYLNLEFEGNGIYLHKDDCINSIYKNGLWCSPDIQKYGKFNKKYVTIEGIFNVEMKGHLGLWSGSIDNISRIWEPASNKKGNK